MAEGGPGDQEVSGNSSQPDIIAIVFILFQDAEHKHKHRHNANNNTVNNATKTLQLDNDKKDNNNYNNYNKNYKNVRMFVGPALVHAVDSSE